MVFVGYKFLLKLDKNWEKVWLKEYSDELSHDIGKWNNQELELLTTNNRVLVSNGKSELNLGFQLNHRDVTLYNAYKILNNEHYIIGGIKDSSMGRRYIIKKIDGKYKCLSKQHQIKFTEKDTLYSYPFLGNTISKINNLKVSSVEIETQNEDIKLKSYYSPCGE